MKKWSKFKKIMIVFAVVSTILTILFFILYKMLLSDLLNTLAITFLTTSFHFDIRMLIGNIVPLYKNNININCKYFKLSKIEKKIYKQIKIKNWKTKIPTYSPEEFDIKMHSFEELIKNMCVSEIIHTIDAIVSYVPLIFIICFGSPLVFLITSILASVFDLQFVIIQRYNRERLVNIKDKYLTTPIIN